MPKCATDTVEDLKRCGDELKFPEAKTYHKFQLNNKYTCALNDGPQLPQVVNYYGKLPF